MKRIIAVFAAVFAALAAWGQNNPYDIDDRCFAYMQEANKLTGKEGFEEAASKMLDEAVAKQDKKAEIIYHIISLRHLSLKPEADINELLSYSENAQKMALDAGYRQYYYQAAQIVNNYYFNHKQPFKAIERLNELQRTAAQSGDQYSEWMVYKDLADFYQNYNARKAARSNLQKCMRIYKDTDDPIIKRQSLSSVYLQYSQIFLPYADSSHIWADRAFDVSKVPLDTVRYYQEKAFFAAVDGNKAEYAHYRNLVQNTPYTFAVSRPVPLTFSTIDLLFDGKSSEVDRGIYKLPIRYQKIISAIAERLGLHQLAENLKDTSLAFAEGDISDLLEMNLSEIEARLGNDILEREVAEKNAQIHRNTVIIGTLVIILLLAAMAALLLHARNLRRNEESERKRVAELQEANERVRKADAAKDRFMQNMTHELRTPLNAITGFSQLLTMPDGTFSPEEKEEFGNHVVNNTKMMTMLLDDLINSSSMDGGGYSISKEDAECGEICREAITSAEHRLQGGVQLLFKPAMELPFVFHTDPLRTQQVLTNLLTNACKHTRQGEIRLGCSLDEAPGYISFSVEDTGPGIPEDQAEHIFERFVKLNDFVQGTGLGLSICREIAKKMDGNVFLDTSYKDGSRFVFRLPVG